MELTTGLWIVAGLFLFLAVPYLVFEIRRSKQHGHTWFTFKPRGTAISELMWAFATRSRA